MTGGDEPDVEIRFPAQPEFVGVARHVLGAMARMGGLSVDAVHDVKLATSEACTNAVTLSRRAGSEEPVVVAAEIEGNRVRIEVQGRGEVPPADPAAAPQDPDSQDFSFESGLSIPLIQGLVDDLDVLPREGGGSVVRMSVLDDARVAPDEG